MEQDIRAALEAYWDGLDTLQGTTDQIVTAALLAGEARADELVPDVMERLGKQFGFNPTTLEPV